MTAPTGAPMPSPSRLPPRPRASRRAGGGVNNSLAQASPVELGAVYNGQVALNDGVDFYAFTLAAADIVHLDLESTWHTYQDTMFIYDASGNEIWKHSNDGDWNETTARATTSEGHRACRRLVLPSGRAAGGCVRQTTPLR